jgi:hypothetical protein
MQGARGRSCRSAGTDEPREHRSDLELGGTGGNHRIACRECAQLILVLGLGLDDTKAPRPVLSRTGPKTTISPESMKGCR